MSGQPTFTLLEALTTLAFDDKVSVSMLPVALEQQRWGCTRADALARLESALYTLCDAGYRGDVALWGRTVTSSPGATPQLGALRRLSEAECLEYRLFLPSYDALWQGANQDGEFGDAFTAHASLAQLGDVCVDLVGLTKLAKTFFRSGTGAMTPVAIAPLFPNAGGTKVNRTPRLADAALKRWWDSLSDTDRDLQRDDLHKNCAAAHPNNSIARKRVRDIEPKQRPGPRPVPPESTA
jgi:hypothetical protein